MKEQDVTVSIDTSQSPLDSLLQSLRSAGLRVDQVLETTGVVTGKIDDQRLAKLRQIKGILSVEEQRTIQLPDRESDLQ